MIEFHLEDCILPPWPQRLKLVRERCNTSYISFATDSRCLEAFHYLKGRPSKRREMDFDKLIEMEFDKLIEMEFDELIKREWDK